jgi:hypothetical protein
MKDGIIGVLLSGPSAIRPAIKRDLTRFILMKSGRGGNLRIENINKPSSTKRLACFCEKK